jgi:AsmA protein
MTGRPPYDPRDIWQQGEADGPPSLPRKPRRPPGRRAQGRRLGVVAYAGLALVCLSLGAVAFLFLASPLDAVRDRLIERVNARIGASVAVAGRASLSLFPRAAVTFSDVAVLPPEGGKAAPIATVPSLEVEVGLWSLLLRQPQVGRLTLNRPAIELSIDADGHRNWEIARKRAPTPETSGPAASAGRDGSTRTAAPAQRLAGGSVRIVDATLRYRDERSGEQYEISALNLELAADDREGPVAVEGALTWRGVGLRVSGTASPLRTILAGQPVDLSLKVSGMPVEAAYAGSLTLKGGITSDGRISLKAASARALADWLGIAWTAGSSGDALAVSAKMTSADAQVTLSSIEASLGDATAAGSLSLDLKGRPRVSGKLQLSEVDLNSLLARRGRPQDAPAPPPSAGSTPPERAKGWSEDAIDLRLLRLADAELAVSVGGLVYKDVKTGPGTLSLIVEGGIAKAAVEAIEVYGGRGKGNLTLDGSAVALALAVDLELVGVSIEPLLKDAADVAWLGGRGTVALTLSGHGLSERQIVETLDGKVDMAVADGALSGIDVGKLMRTIERGRLPSLKPTPGERTAFSELTGSFDIAKGIAKSRDMKLVSAHLQLTGEGAVELGPRRIDYTLHAKISGGAPAEGAVVRIGAIEVPVGIKGPLDAPTFTVVGSEGLGEALKQIGKNLKSRDVQDAVKGLLRGDGDKRTRRDLIDKLLKKE